nr:MAG TPA: hypothetical protein [Caudoviricetes sp.]DAP30768.1 MAG TPA: hypothetical protein [Caudoviricetes sp.]DAT02557.1 MAG TPA: hypothetical protein [Caudoviricetes sp.]
MCTEPRACVPVDLASVVSVFPSTRIDIFINIKRKVF